MNEKYASVKQTVFEFLDQPSVHHGYSVGVTYSTKTSAPALQCHLIRWDFCNGAGQSLSYLRSGVPYIFCRGGTPDRRLKSFMTLRRVLIKSTVTNQSPNSSFRQSLKSNKRINLWWEEFGQSVRQVTVRNKSTNDNLGTLPINCYLAKPSEGLITWRISARAEILLRLHDEL